MPVCFVTLVNCQSITAMKKLYILPALCFLGFSAYAQNLINDGGTINIAAGATISLTSNFNNLNAGAVNNQGMLELAGNFTAADVSNQTGSGTYRFNGTNNPQTLTIGTGEISSIELDNPLGLELQSDVNGVNSLNFINGHIISGPNTLTMNTVNNAVLGASNNRFLVCGDNGLLKYNNVGTGDTAFFPIGYSIGNYNPAWLLNSGTEDNFSAQVFNNVLQNGLSGAPLVDDYLVNRTWDIQEDVDGGSIPAITLQWNQSHQRANFTGASAGIVNYSDINSSWNLLQNLGNVTGNEPFTISRSYSQPQLNLGAFIIGQIGSPTVTPESVGETLTDANMSCSPNPAAGGNMIQVTAKALANKAVSINLYDLAGRVVASDTKTASPKGSMPFAIPHLTPGMYLLNLSADEGRYSSKIIVE